MLLGVEISRIHVAMHSGIETEKTTTQIEPNLPVPYESLQKVKYRTDSQYYYDIRIKNGAIGVKCMSHDECRDVFELRSSSVSALIDELSKQDRFEKYENSVLHRIYVGAEIGRAGIALQRALEFSQDFSLLYDVNTSKLPFILVESDSFGTGHKKLITELMVRGLTESHAKSVKGLARTAVILAVFHGEDPFADISRLYKQGDEPVSVTRENYRDGLLSDAPSPDDGYTYGERTTAYFGHNQLERIGTRLKTNSTKAAIIQRYDPSLDMSVSVHEDGTQELSDDPCMTHDIYFVTGGQLGAFHIARAHNTVNAYPQNIWGLHDAYDAYIANQLGIPISSTMMLSSRANILLLNEQERAKKIIAESTKPAEPIDSPAGPFVVGEALGAQNQTGVALRIVPLKSVSSTQHPMIERLRSYNGVDILQRSINYLKVAGIKQNGTVLSTFDARTDDPMSEHLAFYQANVMAGKLCATAVFTNRSDEAYLADEELAHYIASVYANELRVPLGELLYVRITSDEYDKVT